MSSESSSGSSSSRVRQFGLYRSIDARTEEFLRLSMRRQIRQGCACAAVSTAITITVVVVILLIYEYAIAVEWSIVQRRIGVNGTNETTITKDNPHADKLDRSFFGFDQDYYERMPLLVNALQESNYIDPVIEMSRPISKNPNQRYSSTSRPTYATEVYKQSAVRRTSPRPFYFEYRSATPLPFSKTYGSRSWIDGYRNEQRLQNIRQVIKYLETTINAKAADMHMKPSGETSIAFSGVYVEPKVEKTEFKNQDQEPSPSSTKTVETDWNHQSDPLFKFKPDTPGEVNLLADSSLRFLPIPSLIDDDIPKTVPMFKRVPNRKLCTGNKCNDNIEANILNLLQTSTEITTENPGTTKSFSVMLNLYPLNTKPTPAPEKKRFDLRTRPPISKIYLTTSRPSIQFRKKTTPPVRRHQYRYKKPRYLIRKKEESRKPKIEETHTTQYPHTEPPKATTMVVHVNVYSVENKTEAMKKNRDLETTTSSSIKQSTYTPITNVPELYAGQVEDHHDGSSGVIHVPIHTHTAEPPILPPVTTTHPYYETETANSDVTNWFTEPPNILKFSPEDAKVPEHYINSETTQSIPTSTNRRAMDTDYQEEETLIIKLKNHAVSSNNEFSNTFNNKFSNNYNSYFSNSNETSSTEDTNTKDEIAELESKNLSNEEQEVTEVQTEKNNEASEETLTEEYHTEQQTEETTTIQTYVPLINGHYRSISRSSPEIQTTRSKFFNRKRKIETKMSGFRTYVPMYVEIKRNRTRVVNNTDDENNDDEDNE